MARVGAFWIIGGIMALAAPPLAAGTGAIAPNSTDQAALARFKELDHGGTLQLTPDDLASAGAARRLFAILDRSGDGILTAADGPPTRHLLHRLGARALSRSQFTALGTSRWLAALDVDGDNRLSLAELRPSLAGNAPLNTPPAAPPRSEIVEPPARPHSCWFFDGTRWVELPGSAPTCRLR